MAESGDATDNRVHVSIRMRPPNKGELADPEYKEAVQMFFDEKKIVVTKPLGEKKTFNFDHLFGPKHTSSDVWDQSCRGVVDDVLKGFNGCIMVYGQTGTGKTFTLSNRTPDNMGVIFRALDTIFDVKRADAAFDYRIEVSYIQIYCEMIQDLIAPENKRLAIRESEKGGVFIQGVAKTEVSSIEECVDIFDTGNSHRTVANTLMNAVSSRSHACLIVYINKQQRLTEEDYSKAEEGELGKVETGACSGKLVLVDLAGSERMKKCFAPGTLVHMADGSDKPIEQIREGEEVMGDDLTSRVVEGVVSGRDRMFRVAPAAGAGADGADAPTPFVCNEGHPLVVRLPDPQAERARAGDGTYDVRYWLPSVLEPVEVCRNFLEREDAEAFAASFDCDGWVVTLPVEAANALDPELRGRLRMLQVCSGTPGAPNVTLFAFEVAEVAAAELPAAPAPTFHGFSVGKNHRFLLADGTVVHNTGCTDIRATEGKAINLSLSALGNVIHALSDPKHHKFVPYRDSKLTRLLSDSLGGNSKTSLIICTGPAMSNANETVNSLAFGDRAMRVTQKAKRNVEIDYRALARKLQARLDKIDEEIAESQAAMAHAQREAKAAKAQREKAVLRAEKAEALLKDFMLQHGVEGEIDLGPAIDESDGDDLEVQDGAADLYTGAADPKQAPTPDAAPQPSTSARAHATSPPPSAVPGKSARKAPRRAVPEGGASSEPLSFDAMFEAARRVGERAGERSKSEAGRQAVKLPHLPPSVSTNVAKCNDQLERHRRLLEQAIRSERAEVARLREKNEAELKYLHGALLQAEDQFLQLQEKATGEAALLRKNLDDEHEKRDALKQKLAAVEEQQREYEESMTARMTELNGQLEDVKQEYRDAQDLCELREREKEDLEDEVEALKETTEALQLQVADTERERDAILDEIDALKDEIREKEVEFENANVEIEGLTTEVAQTEHQLIETEEELETTREQLALVQEDLEYATNELETAIAGNATYEEENLALTNAVSSLEELLATEQGARVALRKQLDDTEALLGDITTQKTEDESFVSELQIRVSRSETRARELSEGLAAATVQRIVEAVTAQEHVRQLVGATEALSDAFTVALGEKQGERAEADVSSRTAWAQAVHSVLRDEVETPHIRRVIKSLGNASLAFRAEFRGAAAAAADETPASLSFALGRKKKDLARSVSEIKKDVQAKRASLFARHDFGLAGSRKEAQLSGLSDPWGRLDDTYVTRVFESSESAAAAYAQELAEAGAPTLVQVVTSNEADAELARTVSGAAGGPLIPLLYRPLDDTKPDAGRAEAQRASERIAQVEGAFRALSKQRQASAALPNAKAAELAKRARALRKRFGTFLAETHGRVRSLDEAHAAFFAACNIIVRFSRAIQLLRAQNAELRNIARALNVSCIHEGAFSELLRREVYTMRDSYSQSIESTRAKERDAKLRKRERRKLKVAATKLQRWFRNILNQRALQRYEDQLLAVKNKALMFEREQKILLSAQAESGEVLVRQGFIRVEQLSKKLMDFFVEPKSSIAEFIKKEQRAARKARHATGPKVRAAAAPEVEYAARPAAELGVGTINPLHRKGGAA